MNTITRWNNLAKRFDVISVDALNEKIHDIGNSKPTVFMKKNEVAVLEGIERSKAK